MTCVEFPCITVARKFHTFKGRKVCPCGNQPLCLFSSTAAWLFPCAVITGRRLRDALDSPSTRHGLLGLAATQLLRYPDNCMAIHPCGLHVLAPHDVPKGLCWNQQIRLDPSQSRWLELSRSSPTSEPFDSSLHLHRPQPSKTLAAVRQSATRIDCGLLRIIFAASSGSRPTDCSSGNLRGDHAANNNAPKVKGFELDWVIPGAHGRRVCIHVPKSTIR